MQPSIKAQRGLAMPVTLIILAVMLMSSIYLLKSTNSTTMTAANLAYDSAQARAVDFGLMEGYRWLNVTVKTSAGTLNETGPSTGYVATLHPRLSTRSEQFWAGSRSVTFEGQPVEYVIHRLCSVQGSSGMAADGTSNGCVMTADNLARRKIGPGESLAIDAPRYRRPPKVHFVVTARIAGKRGGNVVNQMVVLVGP
ncbi:hypothetical protein G4G28_14525 [Massilia sp. Dwa41.01b]|uniref:pilus assembly PilX family protein n=1 Tax=unclassified Massilia TaxID=2609279 RepID=UPI00160494FA|nr:MULTISPECIES: hypothetical protein [unclassified Massilia]QNA89384.1 hypothetical protein G4G28_14525 [Massilia sp. Dwa41.01b]QNB00282.1 hypothetical protein G4G31_18100 [Massilia sp. Se16.2.3]